MDRVYWISWYDLPEEDREAYFKWAHDVYIPKALARRLAERVNIIVEESRVYGPAANAQEPAGTPAAPCIVRDTVHSPGSANVALRIWPPLQG